VPGRHRDMQWCSSVGIYRVDVRAECSHRDSRGTFIAVGGGVEQCACGRDMRQQVLVEHIPRQLDVVLETI